MSTNTQANLSDAPWTVIENAFSDRTAEFPGTLTFNGDQLRLDGPCNFFTTQIMVNGNGITIFPFGSMPKTCSPEAMEAEAALLSALMRVTQFAISGNTLTLLSPDGRQMLKAALSE
ncbi:META domain-containing protein [Tateyamaria sp.]|uniref:META domain-containing protein n=1 Tax=Tateyamaria sp. TaxID=1929288 RepID=UPI00329E8169